MGGIISAVGSAVNAVGNAAGAVVNGVGSAANAAGNFVSHELNPFVSGQDKAAYENSTLVPAAQNVNNFLKPVEQPINNALNAVGLGGATLGAGYSTNGGAHIGMADSPIPTTPDQVTNAVSQGINNYNNPAPAPTDTQITPNATNYVNQQGPPNVSITNPPPQTIDNWKTSMANIYAQYNQDHDVSKLQTAIKALGPQPTSNPVNPANIQGPPVPQQSGPPVISGEVNTSTQNPLMTTAQWDAQKAAFDQRYQTDISGYSPAQHAADIANLGPRPGAPLVTPQAANSPPSGNGTSASSGGPSGPPAPDGTSAAAAAAAAAAAGGAAGIPAWAIPLLTGVTSLVDAGSKVAAGNTMADAARYAAGLQNDQFNAGLAAQKGALETQHADAAPWIQAGATAVHQLGDMTSNPTQFGMNDFQQDPGYQFRLSEGLKALQNSAAARGGLVSGNTMKSVQQYGQQQASDEYQNSFNRYMTQKGFQTNALQSLAGVGQTATQQVGQASQNYANNAMQGGQNYANNAGQMLNNAASANASGYVGAANALTGGLSNYMNYSNSNNMLNALLGNKGSY